MKGVISMGFTQPSKMINGNKQLHAGMSKTDVRNLLGEPNGQKKCNGVETLIWRYSVFKGWAIGGGTIERAIEVYFKDNKVTSWVGQNMPQP